MNKGLLIGALAGGISGLATTTLIAKKAKKPIGCKGSFAHIMSNDKLDEQAKKDTFKQIGKQNLKDAKALVGKGLSKVNINNKNLKSMIKDSKIFKKVNALPKPLKAAIATATAALTILVPAWALKSAGDSGYIEAQNEK